MKIGLHEFHTWRVQAMAWYSECTMTVSAKNVHAFTKPQRRAARVVTAKLSLDQPRHDQGFPRLLEVLEWAYGGDSADNILQAVTDLLDCRKGDRDMLSWITQIDHLVYRLANLGVRLDERFTGTAAILNSGLNRDQRAMVVASTGRSLQLQSVLVAIWQLFPGTSTQRVDVMYGAGRASGKTQTENVNGTTSKRVTCWRCRQRGHVQRDCPEKATGSASASPTFLAHSAAQDSGEAKVPNVETQASTTPAGNVLSVVGFGIDEPAGRYPGVCFVACPNGPAGSALMDLCPDMRGSGIVDLGCTDTLCGDAWLRSYLDVFVPDGQGLETFRSSAWFVFGDGGVQHALYQLDLPFFVAGLPCFLRTQVVPGNTPLLIGRQTMACMRMRIDAASGEVLLNLGHGESRVQCTTCASGHLVLNLWDIKHGRR